MTKPNGRGRGYNKKPITRREARRIARYRAGLLLESVLNEGFMPDDLVRRFGEEGMSRIIRELEYFACWLIDTGNPDGKAST